jgi:hypothetical protein
MPRFDVKMVIGFSGEFEAETAAEARKKAWTSWNDTAADITCDGVYAIEVDEIEEDEEEEEDDEDSDES